jgi:hypothetical protein
LRRVVAGGLHLQQLIAVPRPSAPALDELVTLSTGEMQIAAAYTPTLHVAVVLGEVRAGDVAPDEDIQHLLVVVADEPRADAGLLVGFGERDTPVIFLDVAKDRVRARKTVRAMALAGEVTGSMFGWRRWQGTAAFGADFTGFAPPDRGCPLPAHD